MVTGAVTSGAPAMASAHSVSSISSTVVTTHATSAVASAATAIGLRGILGRAGLRPEDGSLIASAHSPWAAAAAWAAYLGSVR